MNEFEKKFDDNELNDMRQQMATLKKKLQQQEIVNDRFIRHSLRRNTSGITRRYVLVSLLSVFKPIKKEKESNNPIYPLRNEYQEVIHLQPPRFSL